MNSNQAFETSGVLARISAMAICMASCSILAEPALAYLGSFNSAGGYQNGIFQTPIAPSNPYNWGDVSYYNAGNYGPLAGGGPGPTLIAPDSGKWDLVSQVGGFFPNSATRTLYVGSAPPYPFTMPPNPPSPAPPITIPAYLVGGHFPGKDQSTDGQNLAFRNDNPPGTGAAVYDYYLDSYDMGTLPTNITTAVSTKFYFLPTESEPPTDGSKPGDKFTLSFMDQSGNIGVEWGYSKVNEVQWRTNGPWNSTSIFAAEQVPGPSSGYPLWDGVDIDINFNTDTFRFDYYDASTSSWINVAPAGTPLATNMLNLTRLRWRLEDDVHGAFAGKNYFDDFSFTETVPEPASAVLLTLSMFGILGLRRNRNR
jgi:hypothetical protein